MHLARANRKANARRRHDQALRNAPLPEHEIARRTKENAAVRDAYRAANPGGFAGDYKPTVRVRARDAAMPLFAFPLMAIHAFRLMRAASKRKAAAR